MVHFSMYAKGVFSERGGTGMTWTKHKGVSFFVLTWKREHLFGGGVDRVPQLEWGGPQAHAAGTMGGSARLVTCSRPLFSRCVSVLGRLCWAPGQGMACHRRASFPRARSP